MDGRRLDGYTISSPCEPNGSRELKIFLLVEINACSAGTVFRSRAIP